MNNTQNQLSSVTSLTDVLQLYKKVIKREIKCLTLSYYSKISSEFDANRGYSIIEVKPIPLDKNQSEVKYLAYNFDANKTFTENEILAVAFADMDFRANLNVAGHDQKEYTGEIYHSENYGVLIPLKAGTGGGATAFDALTGRPKYNNAEMTHSTNIPEVKTSTWDNKLDDAPSDNKQYARKNGAWSEVEAGSGPAEYLKSAEVDGGTLKLKKQDDSTVSYTPTAFMAMKADWTGSTLATQQAALAMIVDADVANGQAYLATVHWSDLPASMGQCEVRAYIISKSASIVLFEASSAETSPYNWIYNSWPSGVHSWLALGGTTVVANPEGAATTDLSKIQIDSTIYENVAFDDKVKLRTDLKTYYNIGKIQNASGTNPVTVAEAGSTLRDVFNALMKMDADTPVITQPYISAFTLSSNASDEVGTEITTVSYSITTNPGSYNHGPATGVTYSKYTFSSACPSTEMTTTTGSLTLSSAYVVGTSAAKTIKCVGTHSAGAYAKNNLGEVTTYRITAGDTAEKSATFSKTSVIYAYAVVSSNTSAPGTYSASGDKKTAYATFASSGGNITYAAGDYIYFYTVGNGKTIQTNVLGQWANVATTDMGDITFILLNGKDYTYRCYRVGPFSAGGTDKYRV